MAKANYEYPKNRKSRKEDLSGMVFGYLTAKEFDQVIKGGTKWFCECVCGNIVSVYIRNIKKRPNVSCGCKKSEVISKAKTTKGGASKRPLWGCYNQMIARCYNPKNKAYKNYGARGITVCDRWLESFFNFEEDMGECPEGLSLERIENHLGYGPENCKWETKSIQQFNQRMDPNNTSGRTGVYWRKDRQKWTVMIDFQNETIRLGCYESFERACEVRAEAELKYFGFTKE